MPVMVGPKGAKLNVPDEPIEGVKALEVLGWEVEETTEQESEPEVEETIERRQPARRKTTSKE